MRTVRRLTLHSTTEVLDVRAEKICVVCQRPMTWRRKWAKCWEQVKYCSERCRKASVHRGQGSRQQKSNQEIT